MRPLKESAMRATAHLILLFFLLLSTQFCAVAGDNFLVLHPCLFPTHMRIVFSVTKEMVRVRKTVMIREGKAIKILTSPQRGHKVTTIRHDTEQGLQFPYLGPNHEEFVLNMNNSDGGVPYVSRGENGIFLMPTDLLWDYGLGYDFPLHIRPDGPLLLYRAQCDALLGNRALMRRLRATKFDVAVIDLVYNECGLALAHELGLPVVGFWASSPAGLEIETTTIPMPAGNLMGHDKDFCTKIKILCHPRSATVPLYMSAYGDEMTFFQRLHNLGIRVLTYILLKAHYYMTDYINR